MVDKVLPLFAYPLGLMLVAGLASLLLSLSGRARWSRLVLGAGLLGLWIASMPVFANWLGARLEASHPPVAIAESPEADVAILLGGAVGQPLPPRVTADLAESADRVLHAARLFKAGKVGAILIAGGNQDWQTAVAPEAGLIAELLVEFGVPADAIAVEDASRNTYENAANSGVLMREHGWRTALLVTSGAHMRRALAVFRRAGVAVVPSPTDIRVTYPLYDSILDVLPNAGALAATTDIVKEHIGLIVYRLRGWA